MAPIWILMGSFSPVAISGGRAASLPVVPKLEFGKEGLPAHDGDYPHRFATIQVKVCFASVFAALQSGGFSSIMVGLWPFSG
jgi:hypothetical protein